MKIRGLKRLDETTRRLDINGDNWHTTWAKDGLQFTSLCDGRGGSDVEGMPGGIEYNTRVLAIRGDAENPHFSDVPSFPHCWSSRKRRASINITASASSRWKAACIIF